MRIISRLDIKNEFLIKGLSLEGLRKLGNPNDFAEKYYKQGADELLYIDSVASLYSRDAIFELLKLATKNIFIPLTVGGGINSVEMANEYFSSGADKIFVNTGAVNNPSLINILVDRFGSANICVSIEAKRIDDNNWNVFTSSGRDNSNINVLDWVKESTERGVGEILITAVDNDGFENGFDYDLIDNVLDVTHIPIIASGGFGRLEHLEKLNNSLSGIAIASALHYGKINIEDIKKHLSKLGIETR
tara:strand:- start:1256 stop:1996 length:741 start_codon:yes stop_codon:yes gene_type:complete